MDRREIIVFINSLEEKFNVNDWKIDGTKIWPIIRFNIAFFLLNIKSDTSSNEIESNHSLTNLFLKYLRAVIELFKLLICKIRGIDYFFVTGTVHRAEVDGKWYNRFCDSLMSYQSTKGKRSVLLEYSFSSHEKLKKNNSKKVFSINKVVPIFYLYKRLMKRPVRGEFYNYQQLLDYLNEEGWKELVSKITAKNLLRKYEDMDVYVSLYRFFLGIFKPTAVCSVCYYNNEGLSLNVAAYSLGIPSIDIQHGVQGSTHVAYSSWTKVPLEGYELLPKVFWSWDDKSNTIVSDWAKNNNYHFGFVGGNPWVEDWKSDFFKDKGKYKLDNNIILYSLQPIDDIFPEFIIQAIKATSKKFCWWIRIHPRQFVKKSEIEVELKKFGLFEKVNIEEATNYPLPVILENTKIHITQWSSVVLEASSYKVPSILIHSYGKELYEDQIISGDAIVFQQDNSSLEAVINSLENINSSNKTGLSREYLNKFDVLIRKLEKGG